MRRTEGVRLPKDYGRQEIKSVPMAEFIHAPDKIKYRKPGLDVSVLILIIKVRNSAITVNKELILWNLQKLHQRDRSQSQWP